MRNIEFINAGAGSGKTTKLVSLLSKNIGSEPGQFKPGEVILTTFTELAAAEFRGKARTALLEAGKYREAGHLDTASIGTIHAVANSFVNKYWYRLGRGPAGNILSESDKQFYINQSLSGIATDQDIELFEALFNEFRFSGFADGRTIENPDFWIGHLESIVNFIEQYDIKDMGRSIEKSCELADNIFNSETEFDEDFCKKTLKKYLEICGNASKRKVAEKIIESTTISLQDLLNISDLNPIPAEKTELPAIDELVSMANGSIRSKKRGERLKQYTGRIFELAWEWVSEFSEYKTTNHLIDYNDMERLFLELLKIEDIAKEIGNRFRLLMVDEFQDSSPMQLKIFDRLSEIVEKSYWVGDPKQAIYGFRGTDAGLVNAISDVFEKTDSERNLTCGEPLNTSYRSRPGLVNLSNKVFSDVFSNIREENVILKSDRDDSTEFGNAIPKENLHWHMKFVAEKKGDRATNADHYHILSQKLIKLLDERHQVYDKSVGGLRNIEPHDIAILCRTSAEVNGISTTLREYGVQVSAPGQSSGIFETAEIKLFLALLNYTSDKRNDLAKAELLHLMDLENFSLEDIVRSRIEYMPARKKAIKDLENAEENKIIEIPVWQKDNIMLKRIDDLAAKAVNLPVTDLTDMLITGLDLFSFVSRWGDSGRRIDNLEKMKRYTSEYDQRCLRMGLGASIGSFIVYLRSLPSLEEKAEKVKGAVNVLTYHRSKGLEWNLVVLESLDYNELKEDELIRKSVFGVRDMLTEEPGESNLYPDRYLSLLPWFGGSKKKLPDDIKTVITGSEVFKSIEAKISEEVKRLLYVGLTRARDYIVTTSYHNAKLNWLTNIGCPELVPAQCTVSEIDVFGKSFLSELEIVERDREFAGLQNNELISVPLRQSGHVVCKSRYLNPSSIDSVGDSKVKVLYDFSHRIPVNRVKKSNGEHHADSEIGTCLHDSFCVYRPGSDKNNSKIESVIKNRLMQSVFTDPGAIIKSVDNLYGALAEKYGQAVKIFRELPVQHLNKDGSITRGTCDLVWETEKGYILIDYKSFQGGIKQLINPEDKHYAGIYKGQLEAYSEILEATGKKVIGKLIYYAVSGYLVEVK